MIYSSEVQRMCPVAKGAYHGPAPIPEEGKWVQAKEIKISISIVRRERANSVLSRSTRSLDGLVGSGLDGTAFKESQAVLHLGSSIHTDRSLSTVTKSIDTNRQSSLRLDPITSRVPIYTANTRLILPLFLGLA